MKYYSFIKLAPSYPFHEVVSGFTNQKQQLVELCIFIVIKI